MKVSARIAAAFGRALNTLGLPCIVRAGEYQSDALGTRVRVRCGEAFTVVTVNDVDVYFHRLNGRIDGVGLRGRPDYRSGAAPE
jgi:ferric-dicitrate binding protein FerR (iron transport regulator)